MKNKFSPISILTIYFCLMLGVIASVYSVDGQVPLGPGGENIPEYQLDVYISVDKSDLHKNETFNLTMELHNTKGNINNFKYSDYLRDDFEINGVMDSNKTNSTYNKENELNIVINEFPKDSIARVIWSLRSTSPINSVAYIFNYKKRESNINKNKLIEINWKDKGKTKHAKIKINRIYPQNKNEMYDNMILTIRNNKPIIKDATISIISPNICNDDKLICEIINKPLETDLIASAFDEEDGSNLTYTWVAENQIHENRTFSPDNSLWILEPNNSYTFKLKATDNENEVSEWKRASIQGSDGKNYSCVSLPSWDLYKEPILALIIAVIAILCIFGFIKSKPEYIKNYISSKRNLRYICELLEKRKLRIPVLLSLIVTALYILGLASNILELKLLAVYELYIYILIFLIFVDITENCFFNLKCIKSTEEKEYANDAYDEKENKIGKSTFWLSNSILMGAIMLYFYLFIPQIEPNLISSHLYNFYSTLIQASGTLLGIIIGIYLAFSRGREFNIESIRILVAMYALLMGLSLLGLSGGTFISFAPLIDISLKNIPNIISIAIFEATCLLIPPSITSLYKLLE